VQSGGGLPVRTTFSLVPSGLNVDDHGRRHSSAATCRR